MPGSLGLLAVLAAFSQLVAAASNAPQWPDQYEVSFKMRIPYISKIQPGKFEYTYQYWRDTANGRQKMIRDGKETQLIFLDTEMKYDVVPAKYEYKCFKTKLGGGGGPTSTVSGVAPPAPRLEADFGDQAASRRLLEAAADVGEGSKHSFSPAEIKKLGFLLPDLSEERWQRNGTVSRDGATLDRYTYLLRESYGYGLVKGQYDFLVDDKGHPVELVMWGINLYTGGHFDDYRAYYSGFKAGPIAEEVFEFDASNCTKVAMDGPDAPAHIPGSGAATAARVLPSVHHGDLEYDTFIHQSGRRHVTLEEYHNRKDVYYRNKNFIEEWNAGNHSHSCAMNQFGDWTQQERRSLLRQNGLRGSLKATKDYKHMVPHKFTVPFNFLPTTVDWRGHPADSPVKDQAACGSCWAFSTVQAMETAYYRATGKQQLFSEQHFLNCAWNVPQNHGCFGGDQDWALEWAFSEGKLATEEELPYVGVFDWCPKDVKGVSFKGHWSLVEPAGEKETMEALLTKGPLTVSIDAAADDMTFYKSGIYTNPQCHMKETELDHAVMLSGYGEEDGKPFWIVKNTWSTYWGEEGYLRVSRSPDDCGIASQVMYAVFDEVHRND